MQALERACRPVPDSTTVSPTIPGNEKEHRAFELSMILLFLRTESCLIWNGVRSVRSDEATLATLER